MISSLPLIEFLLNSNTNYSIGIGIKNKKLFKIVSAEFSKLNINKRVIYDWDYNGGREISYSDGSKVYFEILTFHKKNNYAQIFLGVRLDLIFWYADVSLNKDILTTMALIMKRDSDKPNGIFQIYR